MSLYLTINADVQKCNQISVTNTDTGESINYFDFPVIFEFYEGNTISITVIPKTGYSFSGWGGYSEDLFNMQLFENTELTAIFTEVIVTSDPEITTTCITNFDKSIIVPVIILDWHEDQYDTPSVRDVPTSPLGQHVDTDTNVLHCRSVDLECRFTDLDKDNMISIFDSNKPIYIYLLPESENKLSGWEYHGWLKKKNIKWEYRETNYPDTSGDKERVWVANLIFDINDFRWYSDFPNRVEG